MKFNRFFLIFLVFLSGCYQANVAKEGTLADTGDVYYLTLPSNPPAHVKVYIPIAKYEDFLSVQEHVTPEFTVVSFGAGYKHENAIEFTIVPKYSNFTKFVRRTEHITLAHYKDMPDVVATQIYQQETKLDRRPAFYNIYTVAPKEGVGDEIVIMQYIVDYPHHYANIKFYAHEKAFTDPIKTPRRAIEKTFSPANEYFNSFRLRYETPPPPQDSHEDDHRDDAPPKKYRGT